MSHYEQLINDQLTTLRGQKAYCLSVLVNGGLASWEEKEYRALVDQYDQELTEIGARQLQVAALP
ncbi:hypothetical protein [Pseudomonas sp. EMN2]|uniref:hypothetical protein n=1 Tax=Pseudomonas sp. EMN2 TaxID=2615212 RepID=UPI00129B37E1|nr:hypothetical protein [Pseudomonas sp. EMN2]